MPILNNALILYAVSNLSIPQKADQEDAHLLTIENLGTIFAGPCPRPPILESQNLKTGKSLAGSTPNTPECWGWNC